MLVDTPEWPAELEAEKHEVHPWDHSDRPYLFCRYFLIASIADHHVRWLSSESRMDTFEAVLASDFRCTVDILDIEHATEPVEEHFRQSWHQLAGRDQNVDTILPITRRIDEKVRFPKKNTTLVAYRCLMMLSAFSAEPSQASVNASMSRRNRSNSSYFCWSSRSRERGDLSTVVSFVVSSYFECPFGKYCRAA